jgi:DNA-binding transcriptional regulator YiaG
MNKKIEKKFIYTSLGFPVELHNVEMIEINGTFHPKIDVRKVSDSVIESLITQRTRLTGNQVKFIRTYFSMSLREFAKVVSESHTAVMKWENFAEKPTNMDINIESMLRLYICDRVMTQNKQNKKDFYNQYRKVTEIFRHQGVS